MICFLRISYNCLYCGIEFIFHNKTCKYKLVKPKIKQYGFPGYYAKAGTIR